MKSIENELKESFISFFDFSLSLIETLDKTNGHLKFAVVNMQISLELFLKYYFVKLGKLEYVFSDDKKETFKDFSTVLNAYFSQEKFPLVSKKHLRTILESRNNIVHKGKLHDWDDELAEYFINCVFFIQGTYKNTIDETLIYSSNWSHKISNNKIWRNGAEKFAKKISLEYDLKPLVCPECLSKAMVDMEIFNFDEYNQIEGIQCLSCFIYYDTETAAEIIKCNVCLEKSFLLDKLNEQKEQVYYGMCLNCDNKDIVRKCKNCEIFYFPSTNVNEIKDNGIYYCSESCHI